MLDETKPLPLAEIVVRFEKSSCKLDSRLELADVDVGYVRNGKLHVPRGLYLKQEEYYLAKAEEALNCGSFGGLEPAWLVKAETTITVVVVRFLLRHAKINGAASLALPHFIINTMEGDLSFTQKRCSFSPC